MNKLIKTQESKNIWFSADAWEDADAWEGANDEWESADDWQGADDEYEYAVEPQGKSAKKSQPYILRLVNACTSSIANVDLGDSYLQRAASNFGQNANITLSSVPSGTSYIEFLAQTEAQPFNVGRTVIISATAAQFDETLTITHRDSNGKRNDEAIILTIDPYQTQTDRIIIDREFLFDGYTRIRFSNIRASATVTVQIYPTDKFNAAMAVAGKSAQIKYSEPKIVKVMPVATPASRRRQVAVMRRRKR